MNIYISRDLNSAYIISKGNLMVANINNDNVYSTEDDFEDVDRDLVGDEETSFLGQKTTFNEIYDFIIMELSNYRIVTSHLYNY